jgi:hypothetical protein
MEYTCADYRIERILLSLKLRLQQEDLSAEERGAILFQIKELEATMGLD